MAKTKKPVLRRKNREPKPLYIGRWIKALKLKKVDIAKTSGYSGPYITQLAKNTRINPSNECASSIADAMGLTLDDLRKPPPPAEALEQTSGLSPAILERLRRAELSSKR